MSNEILRLKPEEVAKLFAEGKMELLSTPERAKEILGRDFLGVEAVKTLEDRLRSVGVNMHFVIDKLPPFLYAEEDLQVAKATGEMLVLRPEEMIRNGIKQPITLTEFGELFQKDPLGKLQSILKEDNDKYKKDWYKTHTFAIDSTEIKLGWALVKKEPLVDSTDKSWIEQEQLLRTYAGYLELKGAKHISLRRRTAIEAMYDTLLYYVNTGERLLSDIGDRVETFTNDGEWVVSLFFRPDGLVVSRAEFEDANPYEGIYPTRPVEKVDDKSTMEQAQQIFGKDFFGSQQIKKTFGVNIDENDIPGIPFSQQELEGAKELGQFLILRVDKAPDKKPLTIKKIEQLLQNKFEREKKGRVLSDQGFLLIFDRWYDSEDFFKKDIPRIGWALVSKDIIPKSTGKTYLQQTDMLVDYLGDVLPNIRSQRKYYSGVSEFLAQEDAIAQIKDPKEAARRLSDLKLNQATRQTPVEAVYDLLVYFENTGQRLLKNIYTWTSKRDSYGKLIFIGCFHPRGIFLGRRDANMEGTSFVGVCFSR